MNEVSRASFNPPSDANSVLPRGVRRVLANLAFGGLNLRGSEALTAEGLDPGRHLAYLPTDVLELDLADESRRQFGDYELLEMIGEGGMGVVYRARQISLDREVAVKLLSAGPWASREFVERFQHEAQNAARMQHPNIVTIHEVGTVEELHFFSMRLIRGPSLADVVKSEGKLPALRAARLLRTIAEALDYAHRLGVLHLDLKPANVLLDENGEPHVADFGLARRLDRALAADRHEISGTPSYMAPEQARGETLTAATDIWGMGAILYELATGQPLFRGETPQATLKHVLANPVPAPRGLARSVPPDLEAVVLKCLRKDPAERYPTARALADDLSRFIEGRPVRARPLNVFQRAGRWVRREPKIAGLALLVFVALIGGLIATTAQWRLAQSNARAAASNANLANDRLWQSRIDQAATALRDGHSYDALPLLAANIREREAQGLDAREDRIRIAMTERSAPRLIDVIQLGTEIRGIALSPDGASVAVSTQDQKLRLFDIATGTQRWETDFSGATRFLPKTYDRPIWLAMLKYSADGRYVIGRDRIGVEWPMPTGMDEILFAAADGKVLTPPPDRLPAFRDATYSADGAFALVYTADQRAVLMRTADWQVLGTPKPLGERVRLLANGGRYLATSSREESQFSVLTIHDARSLAVLHRLTYASWRQRVTAWAASPDGEFLIVGHWDGRIERVAFASGVSQEIRPSSMGRIGWITFSPDGRWFGAVGDSGDVLVWDSATGNPAAPPMRLNVLPSTFRRDQMMIDASARTVLASSDMDMALWQVPNELTPPVRLSGQFSNTGAFWFRAYAYDAKRELLATDGGGAGELLLWRTQSPAPVGAGGSPLSAPELRAHDGRVVAVDGNRVTIVGADRQQIGPALELAQVPSFADLTDDGASLVVTVGPVLSVYDASDGRQRRAPIALPNDPARVLLSPDSRHALLVFADYDDGHNRELGQNWDLATGAPTSPPLEIAAADGLRFSADGGALLQWDEDRVRVADAFTLQPRWAWVEVWKRIAALEPTLHLPPDARTTITQAKYSRDGSQVDVLAISGGQAAAALWHIDAKTGRELGHELLSASKGGEDFVVMPDQRDYIVQRPDFGPLWWGAAHGARELPGLGAIEHRALALAPDASMFARATTDAIVLTSTKSLQWLSPPLPTSLPRENDARGEYPAQLAFTADGSFIFARSRQGRLLRWNVAPDLRPAGQLVREADWLSPGPTAAGVALRPAPTLAERSALRAEDPGAPVAHGAPQSGDAFSPRRPDTGENLIDLDSKFAWNVDEEIVGFAPGLHRFLDIDYDVRGAIGLVPGARGIADMSQLRAVAAPIRRLEGIRPGIHEAAAIDVLVQFADSLLTPTSDPHAIVEIAYRDGSRERLPIRYTNDMNAINHGGKDGTDSVPIAWRATLPGAPAGDRQQTMFAVRLANPHPERELASLALEATGQDGIGATFYAVTLEPERGSVGPGR
jgi:WD40 repeat protein